MNFYQRKSVRCPVCGKEIKYDDLPALETDIGLVAVDHVDHIVVIKYDDKGTIRDLSVYPIGIENHGGQAEKCPTCGKEILIPVPKQFPSEYLYNHGDHVVIVFLFDADLYKIITMPLVKLKTYEENRFIRMLISKLGVDGLSALLAQIALGESEEITVPADAIPYVEKLLEVLNKESMRIKPGDLPYMPQDYYLFFKKMIENHMEHIEALTDKIKASLQLVEKVTNLAISMLEKTYYHDPIRDLMDTLKRKGLYLIILRRLHRLGYTKIEEILQA
ncbi:MAG: hypothetical protein ACP6IP_01005 [Candidatus Njordarchaeia archaeon]